MKSDVLLIVLSGAILVFAAPGVWLLARVVLSLLQQTQRVNALRARELGALQEQSGLGRGPARRAAQAFARRTASMLRRLAPQLFVWRDARRCERRGASCGRELPDLIDILTLGLQAGLSFDAALAAYVERFDTTLARELEQAQLSYQLGICSRRQAFQQLCDRAPDDALLRFVAVSSEALALGTPLLPTFATLSFELRRYQKLKLEERIARAPVKLLVPLGLCVLPAVLILLMGPVLIQMIAGLRM